MSVANAGGELDVDRRYVAQAADVCRRAARGDLEARTLDVDAPEELAEQVQGIQSVTGRVVGAIQGITTSITGISEASMVVSASVKEQQVAAAGIRASSDVAADAATQVSDNVGAVAASAKLTEESSIQLLAAANELARLAETLRGDVDTFLHGIRTAA